MDNAKTLIASCEALVMGTATQLDIQTVVAALMRQAPQMTMEAIRLYVWARVEINNSGIRSTIDIHERLLPLAILLDAATNELAKVANAIAQRKPAGSSNTVTVQA
jgi:hypothetical protein